MSFPLHDSLLDRNVILSIEEEKIIIENDWLGSIPVFYNDKERIISSISHFCLKNRELHPEGLLNFCQFGYSVFEQTIFKDVKFMRYFSKIILTMNTVEIENKPDPIAHDSFLQPQSNEQEVINKIKSYINTVEAALNSDIIIPTSGGYDSRLLNVLLNDKKRIYSYTYGISKNQSKSFEVVYARKLSEILNTKWAQIELNSYHKYMDQWFNIYGFSTHLHGMYHIEFYHKIVNSCSFINPTLLSGIFGDVWAGNISYSAINSHCDVIKLGYTHGMSLDPKYIINIGEQRLISKFYDEHRELIKNDTLKVVYTIRMKLILISYIMQIPEYFGIPTWTPFLNFEIVKSMLNIDEERRRKRIWQHDFFKTKGVNIEDFNLKMDRINKLDYEIAKTAAFTPIDVTLMNKYIYENELVAINAYLRKEPLPDAVIDNLLYIPKVGGALRRLGFQNNFIKKLYEYYIIMAIEKGLVYGA
jgi:hypothetical protein